MRFIDASPVNIAEDATVTFEVDLVSKASRRTKLRSFKNVETSTFAIVEGRWLYKSKKINIYTHIHIYIYTYTHIHIYTYAHIYIYIYSYTHIHIYTYTHIHIYKHAHIYTYTHTHVSI